MAIVVRGGFMTQARGRVAGKVAIVTGAAGGLGAAQARVLAAEGAHVVATDVSPGACETGPDVLVLAHDVTSEAGWLGIVEAAERRFGPVSILVNNAGIVHKELTESMSEADYRRVIDVNQIGVWLGMKSVLESMKRAEGGSIINLSSTAGLVGLSGIMSYVAAKWAVRGMTKAAAQEFATYGVRVNSVHPGVIDTAMNADRAADPLVAAQPIKRYGTADEVARMVLFLASDESSYSTGSEFVVDGGFTSM
jgi:3alpha(or 20beta)-hydroxysteroid dehydrogenase